MPRGSVAHAAGPCACHGLRCRRCGLMGIGWTHPAAVHACMHASLPPSQRPAAEGPSSGPEQALVERATTSQSCHASRHVTGAGARPSPGGALPDRPGRCRCMWLGVDGEAGTSLGWSKKVGSHECTAHGSVRRWSHTHGHGIMSSKRAIINFTYII